MSSLQTNEEVCSICLEALDELCFVGECGHKHHALCLCEWYSQCEMVETLCCFFTVYTRKFAGNSPIFYEYR